MTDNLQDIPLELIQRCGQFVQAWQSRDHLDFERIILWHPETMSLLMMINETQALLSSWRRAWRRKTKDENLMAACAGVLALEILATNFMGWGTQYPLAHAKAERLLAPHAPEDRTRLMNIFKVNNQEDPEFATLVRAAFDPIPARVSARAVRLWMSDTTGVLRPAVESYLTGGSMRPADVAVVRDYLREWIVAPGWVQDQDLDRLRAWVNELETPDDIRAWLDLATHYGIDPLMAGGSAPGGTV